MRLGLNNLRTSTQRPLRLGSRDSAERPRTCPAGRRGTGAGRARPACPHRDFLRRHHRVRTKARGRKHGHAKAFLPATMTTQTLKNKLVVDPIVVVDRSGARFRRRAVPGDSLQFRVFDINGHSTELTPDLEAGPHGSPRSTRDRFRLDRRRRNPRAGVRGRRDHAQQWGRSTACLSSMPSDVRVSKQGLYCGAAAYVGGQASSAQGSSSTRSSTRFPCARESLSATASHPVENARRWPGWSGHPVRWRPLQCWRRPRHGLEDRSGGTCGERRWHTAEARNNDERV